MLETEWALRFAYKFKPTAIVEAFKKTLSLPNVYAEEPATIAQAIEWHEQGLDFADAFHLASAAPDSRFATFDEKFARKAAKLAPKIEFIP